MDKVATYIKVISTQPTVDPVKEVEFGCEHLQGFWSNATASEKLVTAYINLQNSLGKPSESQTTKDPKDPKKIPMTTLRPTYLCLQCSTVSSLEDRDSHYQASLHCFSSESRSGCLYCGKCEDFVYDPRFEKIRIDRSTPASNGKKRKLNSIYPTGEEDKFLLPHSNNLSCLAGSPRGIFDLGQTCYLSVILQAMIHNPLMRNYFLSSRHDTAECTITNCTVCALTASFTDILATERKDGHGPLDMLYSSWKNHPVRSDSRSSKRALNPQALAGHQQQDAHEYFQSLLDQLHASDKCTKGKDSKICNCLYHQVFFGIMRSTVTCRNCNNVTVAEDPMLDLNLDLRQHAKRRKMDPKSAGAKAPADDTPLELTQCIGNYTSPEKLGIDSYICRSKDCGNTPQRATKHQTIKKLPPTLCIQLKRYEHNKTNPQKLDTKLTFPLQLDMSPYTARAFRTKKKGLPPGSDLADINPNFPAPLSSRSPGWYDLSTVVVHIGKMDAGHYLCYCRRDDQWFKFDNSKVTLATEAQVLNAEAYMLFYIIRSLGASGEKEKKEKVEDMAKKTEVEEE